MPTTAATAQPAPVNQAPIFRRFAQTTARAVGSSAAFITAVIVVIAWAVMGPMFRYSDTWQLVINTGTTIITFLVVFLIQNTQNREGQALQLKLDELLRAVTTARTGLVGLENLSDEELAHLQEQFLRLRDLHEHHEQERKDAHHD
ncbi:MAG TPA: low affinity iron permease family protein [Gemmatimonadaceae bacterium]|jgi:low affinity Fe/Cu permease|nr:low affinity iron permease family protein [Gemmatimonadaceae bacterium]